MLLLLQWLRDNLQGLGWPCAHMRVLDLCIGGRPAAACVAERSAVAAGRTAWASCGSRPPCLHGCLLHREFFWLALCERFTGWGAQLLLGLPYSEEVSLCSIIIKAVALKLIV